MIFYDFEVFKYNWLIKAIDIEEQKWYTIWDNPDELKNLYEKSLNTIYIGFNNKHYDQYIFKGILLGMNPKHINDEIIINGKEGWQISKVFNKIPMINYDVFTSKTAGLKTLEGFMGSNIKETDVDFNLDRPLTEEEKRQTELYCEHDVEETIKVFLHNISDFNNFAEIVKTFNLPISCIGYSSAQITAKVLECKRTTYNDEFDYFFLPCIKIEKYKHVVEWFKERQGILPDNHIEYYKDFLETDIAGVPHIFGFGGLHGAPKLPSYYKGAIYHVDVRNYYPSMLIAWDLVTRSATNNNYEYIYKTRQALKDKQQNSKTKEEAKKYKKMQLPYKQLLNALSGAMKDKGNAAYDPRNNNCMCINGQLMMLDLIEHLEKGIDDFILIQTNTDGLIVQIPDTDEAFNKMDDICYEWEQRCSTDKCKIILELDSICEIYQKDVNNYLWIDSNKEVERKGSYVKVQSPIDYDLPIINEALVEYMVNKIPLEDTINNCDELIKFQKIVKLSSKYHHVEHENGNPIIVTSGKRVIKKSYEYTHTDLYSYKCYRVFASNDISDGRLLKVKVGKNGEKFANTPEHCFIYNDDVTNIKVLDKLDRQWYINLAKKRLKDFGISEV